MHSIQDWNHGRRCKKPRQKSIADTFILVLFNFNLAVAGARLLLFLSSRYDCQEINHLLAAIHKTLELGIGSSLFRDSREVTAALMCAVAQAPGSSRIRIVRADGATPPNLIQPQGVHQC